MFRSIRWRLVASYVLLALLTACLVGVLAMSLVKRYVEHQAVEEMEANAEAVARQALSVMWPIPESSALHQLAQTSAFLGNARVRILDDRQQVLADSGSPTNVNQFMWFIPPVELDLEPSDQPWMMAMSSDWPSEIRFPQGVVSLFRELPSGTRWTIVSRVVGAWGSRFSFEGKELQRWWPFPQAALDTLWSQEALAERSTPRSDRVVTVPIGEIDDPMGYVELSSGPDFGAEALATTRQAFLLAAGAAMTLAVIVGLLISHGLTAPLRSLAAAASQMSNDLSTRAPVRAKDEIGQLAQQFNQMAERLEASFTELAAERDALRCFIADASHQLRTPITALKNFNELLQGAAADDPAASVEFLAESAVQLNRLEWITHNLLDLSRLDAGLAALELSNHDAGELVESAAAPFKVLAQEKGVAFSTNPPASPLELNCDRARVELALSNLLDNAFKFTPAGGSVTIGAGRGQARFDQGESVELWVQDSGPGIDPADQPRIFERFYQGRGGHAEGCGLGLAIVQSVVQAHGGHIRVESEPGTGSHFVIDLPL